MPGRAASGEVALSVAHAAVHFGGLVALSDLDFKVFDGEIVALIGPNGAGKTTAFNVFTGFLKAAAGEVRYRNTLLNGLKPHHIAALGLVRTFQRTSIFERNTVFENVLIGLHRRGRSSLWDTLLALPRERVAEAELADEARHILHVVGLERRAADMAGTLPYGEQRLLGMALALAAKPSMLLLDEPVSGMNASESTKVMRLVQTIRASGVTILLVEHDMPMVMQVSDRIVVLNYGRIIAEGPPAMIQKHQDVIRAYLGEGKKRA
jgi:branched-chain amino acid transport system ATP-binding protein